MEKFFCYADRFVPVRFFELNPVVITLKISDETDEKIIEASKLFAKGDKEKTISERRACYREALESVIGKENTEKLLARSEEADCFAIYSVWKYLLDHYAQQKGKNLSASAG